MKRLQLSGHFGIAQLHSFHTTSCDCWNSVVWRTKVGIKRLEYSRQVQGSSEGPFIFHDSLWGLLTLWGLHLPHSWIFFPTWSCIPHFFSKGVGFWTLFFGVCCTEDPSYDIRIWSSYQSFHLGPRVSRSNSVGVVSVCLGCYNKNSRDWVAYVQQKFIVHSSGDWKSKIREPAWFGEGRLSVRGLLKSSRGCRAGTSVGSFFLGYNPIHESSAKSPPKGLII